MSFYNKISSCGAAVPRDCISILKLLQLINGRGAVSGVQKKARIKKKVIAKKAVTRKAVIKKIVRKRVISAARKAVIKERLKAKLAQGEALNRPVRSCILTVKARPDNSK